MFDYSNVTPRDFELLAQEYLESTYQGSSWNLTRATGDGNRDIELSYQFFDQNIEYWAEAKFTKSRKASKLQKGQLDPTLLSAMLYSKPVFIKFISNNSAPENYFYRLTDFRIKTNIGVTMVLKDEFEQWLRQNPNVCQRYGINKNVTPEKTSLAKKHPIAIIGALITNEINLNGYTLERKLIQGNTYFLYILIDSDKVSGDVSIKFQTPGFLFISDSTMLNDSDSFSLRQGTNGYKFRFLAEKQYTGAVKISLYQAKECVFKTEISDVSVLPASNYIIAYAQQSKVEAEILEFSKGIGEKNQIAIILGSGASGKSYLAKKLYRELSRRYETFYISFCDNELYNCSLLYQLLLFLNIGDTSSYTSDEIKAAISQHVFAEKRLFLLELLERGNYAPEKCIEFLHLKQQQNRLQIIFPQHNTMRKIFIIEDIHKLKSYTPAAELFHHLLKEFSTMDNNQMIIATTRESFDISADYQAKLEGLSCEDKIATLRYYFSNIPKEINFHRITDSVLIFSNLLREVIENDMFETKDSLRFMAQIKHHFEHIVSNSLKEFQFFLNKYTEYSDLIELVFIVGSGIPYLSLVRLFNAENIDYLIAQKVFKLMCSKVYPFHDYYVSSFFIEKSISIQTINLLEALAEIDKSNSYIYLALLLKQGNALFFSKIEYARQLRDRYFNLSKVHESFLLAQSIVDHIDFNEPLTMEEIYDIYVLATSSFYSRDCDEITSLYNKVLDQGWRYKNTPKMWGVLLRTRTELMNQYYWDLKLDDLETELQLANDIFPLGEPDDHEIIRFACIHRHNRRMVFELLTGEYRDAEEDYNYCVKESLRLNHQACLGFAEMDYGKGLYLINISEALKHMVNALNIFKELGTEHRRLLDCACEVAFLRCLVDGINPENVYALESAALALRECHYEEIYAKAKLKLAALHLCKAIPNLQNAESEILEAEYVLSFRPCKRLDMLFSNIKFAYYTLNGQYSEAQRELKSHEEIAKKLGQDYKTIPKENTLLRFARQAAFYKNDYLKPANTLWIDPRIW